MVDAGRQPYDGGPAEAGRVPSWGAPDRRRDPRLTVATRMLDDPGDVLAATLPDRPLAFVRRGDGIVGIGEAVRFVFTGPARMRDASATWRRLVERATVEDGLRVRGTGLVAFGAFAFADDSAAPSVLVVPRIVIGRRHGRAWMTTIDPEPLDGDAFPAVVADVVPTTATASITLPTPAPAHLSAAFGPGRIDEDAYAAAVAEAVRVIRAGGVEKVVLARDRVARLPADADRRGVLVDLAAAYPDCVTFAVDGLVGATPETLARTDGRTLTARVLAGSAARGADAESDRLAAESLAADPKDLEEHAFARASLVEALGTVATDVRADPAPFRLQLPNLWHLASDVSATLPEGTTALDVADVLHPTAAVAGTPRAAALDLIARLEGTDRGRYAGPVGWMGASGDGEWMLALRSAQIDDDGTVTAWAGAGIVAGSVPDREVAETALKLRPVTDALA